MTCETCKNPNAYQMRTYVEAGRLVDECDRCGDLGSDVAATPDVYWPGSPYYSKALDVEFKSRAHKAAVLKEMDVREVGDRINGSRGLGAKNWVEGTREYRAREWRDHSRHKVRETYQRWLERARS